LRPAIGIAEGSALFDGQRIAQLSDLKTRLMCAERFMGSGNTQWEARAARHARKAEIYGGNYAKQKVTPARR
ncbi:hypothetical protein, partial [Cereibacter sphaeroides]